MEDANTTLHAVRDGLRKGDFSAEDYLERLLARAEALNPQLNVYLRLDAERLLAQQQAQLKAKPGAPLSGLPVSVKDNLCIEGEVVSCASKILQGYKAPYDATVIRKLKDAGAVIVPGVNMDEFAFGSSTENSAFGPARNPWDTDYVPGGSSGGSAAAVGGEVALAAIGSDTGGSIRQPAAFCGVVGLKPTYGRVSRYGLIAFASSLDQIGPLTKDVRDAALLLRIIAGHDPADSTSAPQPVPDYEAALDGAVKGLRVGIPEEYFVEGLDPEIGQAVEAAIAVLEAAGMQVKRVKMPHTRYAVATYYIVATAEASSNLSRYDGVKYGTRVEGAETLQEMYTRAREAGFGPESKRRILLGTYVLSHGYYDAYYLKGLKVRTLIRRDFEQAFADCDILLTPTSPTPAFKVGERSADPLQMYLSDICTISANLAGVPAVSVPGGFTRAGLPIGIQFMCPPFEEARMLKVAHAYEQATSWHTRRPELKAAR